LPTCQNLTSAERKVGSNRTWPIGATTSGANKIAHPVIENRNSHQERRDDAMHDVKVHTPSLLPGSTLAILTKGIRPDLLPLAWA
jgi:hypothetical protein